MEVSAGYGITEHGDNEELLVDFVTGADDGRGSIMFALSWYDRDHVFSRDRDWSSTTDFTDMGGPKWGSSRSSPPALFRYNTSTWEPDPECGEDPRVSWVGPSTWGAE